MVARILEQNHYNRRPLDAKTSKELLDGYLEALDYNRMVFEKSDVEGFRAAYGEGLALKVKDGDIQASLDIFERFLKPETQAELTGILRESGYRDKEIPGLLATFRWNLQRLEWVIQVDAEFANYFSERLAPRPSP